MYYNLIKMCLWHYYLNNVSVISPLLPIAFHLFTRTCDIMKGVSLVLLLLLTGRYTLMCHSGFCQNVLGTRAGKRTTDGTRRPGCHRPAGHHLVHGVCIIQSHSRHKFLPKHSATHGEGCVQFVFRLLMARLYSFLSHSSQLHETGM